MVIDHALWVTGRTGRIVQRYSIPLISRQFPDKVWIACFQEGFIGHFPEQFATVSVRVVYINYQRFLATLGKGLLDDHRKLPVSDQNLRFTMI